MSETQSVYSSEDVAEVVAAANRWRRCGLGHSRIEEYGMLYGWEAYHDDAVTLAAYALSKLPANRQKSKFQQRLDADPALAQRCETVAHEIREAAREDIEAGNRSDGFKAIRLGTSLKIIHIGDSSQ